MGAVFAGAARAPITAVVILFELTGEYSIILPLMLAIVLATGVSHLVSHDTVYTRKLLRRGIDIDEHADAALRRRTVESFMVAPPEPLSATLDLHDAAARFGTSENTHLPVVDDDGTYLGTLAAHDVMNALAAGDNAPVGALVQRADPVLQTLRWAVPSTGSSTEPGPSPSSATREPSSAGSATATC